MLLAYDEDTLALPQKGQSSIATLNYETALQTIKTLKSDLAARNEATTFFGNDRTWLAKYCREYRAKF